MQLVSLLVGLLAVGGSWAAPTVLGAGDVKDFVDLIPIDKFWDVVSNYLAYDSDVKNLVGYLHTNEFKRLAMQIDAMPEFIEFLNSLEESGYEAYKYINIIHTVLGLPGLENSSTNKAAPPMLTGGISGLVGDVKALLEENELEKIYEEKLKSNPRFRTLVDLFQGPTFKSVIGKVISLPEIPALLEKMGLTDLKDGKLFDEKNE